MSKQFKEPTKIKKRDLPKDAEKDTSHPNKQELYDCWKSEKEGRKYWIAKNEKDD